MYFRLEALVCGRVQGVGFRVFVEINAIMRGLGGYAKNTSDGCVEVVAEGEKSKLEEFLAVLEKGPPLARVAEVKKTWSSAKGVFKGFSIMH